MNAHDGTIGAWFDRHTVHEPAWTLDELVSAKAGRRVAAVLPALNEEHTVAGVVASILPARDAGLVDEILVVDSGSTDATIDVARAAGARVLTREEALPGIEPWPGKGEVLWRSLAATTADFVVFVDSDLKNPSESFVPHLLGPLLTMPGVEFVKGFYRRPLGEADGKEEHGGGRVTELVARPLLAALQPGLGGVLQPLGGEYGGSRALLSGIPFASGYGVEIAMLIDVFRLRGPEAMAQVNLGVRRHRNRPVLELGIMARQVTAALLRRSGVADGGAPLRQWVPDGTSFREVVAEVDRRDRPAMRDVLAERAADEVAL